MKESIPLSVYIHIPWCVRKCAYCDFNSYPLAGTIAEAAYLDALALDLQQETPNVGNVVSTIFIGGGTPSLFSPPGIARLLTDVHTHLSISANAEITMEVNPGTVNASYLMDLKAAGINRLSLGVQSFNDDYLASLGRIHNGAEARAVFTMARRAHFDNINLDLMFNLPAQDLPGARADLLIACHLAPEHISYYQLTIEPHTAFYHHPPLLPDEDAQWAMQEQGITLLTQAGYAQYEIAAYSKPDRHCRHNLNYWEFGDYLGIGAGAHGKITNAAGVRRRWKVAHPQEYLQRRQEYPLTNYVAGDEFITSADLPVEFMLNALRLLEGVPMSLYTQRTGLPITQLAAQIMTARAQGWLEDRNDRLIPTKTGQQFLNNLLELFFP